jgi:hypothetical protein
MTTSAFGARLGRIVPATALAATAAAWTLGLPAVHAQAAVHPGSRQVSATRPPGRQWASFAYDPPRHELVLFGGNSQGTVFGDTWIRRGDTWAERHPARSPSPRTGAAMVFDRATRQLLLFGGSARPGTEGGFNAETWIWTGSTWRMLHPAGSPPARHNADIIYDSASHDVILFGGYDGSYLGDTWAWNGTTWTPLAPADSPSPRDSESLVYDRASRTAIMYGGFSSATGRLSDTWSWDGTNWTQLTPATSPGLLTIAWQAAYDPVSSQVLLFGGDPGNGNPPSAGTWAWTGTTWTRLAPAFSPGGRAYGSMTWNTGNGRIVLFGGSSNGLDSQYPHSTWEWNGRTWARD